MRVNLENFTLVIICKHFIFSELRDFCQSDKLEAACGDEEVIVMDAAEYGRMELTKDGQVPHLIALFLLCAVHVMQRILTKVTLGPN